MKIVINKKKELCVYDCYSYSENHGKDEYFKKYTGFFCTQFHLYI